MTSLSHSRDVTLRQVATIDVEVPAASTLLAVTAVGVLAGVLVFGALKDRPVPAQIEATPYLVESKAPAPVLDVTPATLIPVPANVQVPGTRVAPVRAPTAAPAMQTATTSFSAAPAMSSARTLPLAAPTIPSVPTAGPSTAPPTVAPTASPTTPVVVPPDLPLPPLPPPIGL